MPLSSDKQSDLKAFLERRHPDYARLLPHWNFCEATYEGGPTWFVDNLFKYIKEGESEFAQRVKRAYRFNHTREIVDLVQKYIFKSPIARNEADAPQEIKAFWSNATLRGLSIDQYMRLLSNLSSIFGRVWVFVDTNKREGALSIADEKAIGARIYAYHVTPQNVLDFAYDETDGGLRWMLVRETVRDDIDPIVGSGAVKERFRLWLRDEWFLFTVDVKSNRAQVRIAESGVNALGVIPCFPLDHVIGENHYVAPALINDIAYLDRAVANYLSNLDAIIQDQTFSQLAMPAQNVVPGTEAYQALIEMGTKRIFLYDGEGGAGPAFISPDPRQAGMIVTVINKIINEIYHSVGMAGERTKQDNAVGIDNSSGVAKAYDFERLNSLLTTKSASLQNAENQLVELVLLYHGKGSLKATLGETSLDLVRYADTFDVRSLYDEFEVANNLALVAAPDVVRQEQMKALAEKLFPNIAKSLRDRMIAEIEDWPLDPVEQAAKMAQATAPTKFPDSGKSDPKAPTENRQGQVTDKTQKKTAA